VLELMFPELSKDQLDIVRRKSDKILQDNLLGFLEEIWYTIRFWDQPTITPRI
jgi:hypothetical protein